jgi:hypothetical protein
MQLEKKSAFEENLLNHFAVILTHIPPISLDSKSTFMASLSKEHLSRIERKFERSQTKL